MTAPSDPYREAQFGQPGAGQPSPGQPYYQQQQQPPPPGQYYEPHPQQGYYPPEAHSQQPPPRRKRRIFLWVFLVIQVIFIVWIIAGAASKGSGPSVSSQVAQTCSNGGWQGLFKSHADCVKHYAVALNDATNTGKGIGIAIIVLLWVVVDFFLGVGYGIYKLASR